MIKYFRIISIDIFSCLQDLIRNNIIYTDGGEKNQNPVSLFKPSEPSKVHG